MAVASISALDNGKLLQIMFSEGIRNQLSRDFRDWDMVKQMKVDEAKGRELRYMLQTSYGPAAIQYRGTAQAAFPSAQKATTQELTAEYKDIDLTVEIDYNLWNRLQKSKDVRYFDALALELQSKMDAAKRRLGADLYGDGTGVVGEALVITDAASSDHTVVTLQTTDTARGHIGFFEAGDLLTAVDNDGTAAAAVTLGSGTHYAWRVKSKNRRAGTVTLESVTSAGAVNDLTASNIAVGDVFYRVGQNTQNLDFTGTIADYGTATEVMLGLESLAANDGRTVNGLVHSGFTGGSRYDASASALDVSHIQNALDDAKLAAGEGAYSYKRMIMSPEAHAALIESREADRRFHTVEDNKRGLRYFAYQHRNDSVETYVSEYCPKKRIYMIPENKATGGKVLEFYGSDFEAVKVNDSSAFMLKSASGGGYERKVQHFMEAYVQLVCKHPAAIGVVHNFTL
jgi:hypothetical protein